MLRARQRPGPVAVFDPQLTGVPVGLRWSSACGRRRRRRQLGLIDYLGVPLLAGREKTVLKDTLLV